MKLSLRNIIRLCGKEITSLRRDHVLFVFMIYAFSLMIYAEATGTSHELVRASVGIVDEDHSALSQRIADAFLPPRFQVPVALAADQIDKAMDSARFTFVIDIPPDFQADTLAGRSPRLKLLIDATAVMQAGIGANDIQAIIADEISRFVGRDDGESEQPVALQLRVAFNQGVVSTWFTGTMALLEVISMLAIVLTGAALMRERERGTLEHLLVMPVRPVEMMLAKIIANGGVILGFSLLSQFIVLQLILGLQVAGSLLLFTAATAIYLFFAAALGIFLATMTGTMAQFALLFILVHMPMQLLSGALTPIEAMPRWLRIAVEFLPTKHYVTIAQAILARGAGFDVVWQPFLAIFAMGLLFFAISLMRFRSFLARQQ